MEMLDELKSFEGWKENNVSSVKSPKEYYEDAQADKAYALVPGSMYLFHRVRLGLVCL